MAEGEHPAGVTIAKAITIAAVEITDTTISGNDYRGIRVEDAAQAEISNSLVSGNATGILLSNSVQAKIKRNAIINNEGYGVALSI